MNNKPIMAGLLFAGIAFIVVVLAMFNTSISSAAPLMLEATPTPIITYWTGAPRQFTWSYGENTCLDDGDWIQEIDDYGTCPELVAPQDNYPAGIILTLNSKTFDGDSRLAAGSNTNLAKKFTDKWGDPYMSVDETICIGTTGGCSSVSMSPDANSDWEGYLTEGDYNYLRNVYINQSLGSEGSLSFTIEPIWYGEWECEIIEPEEREFISTGLLLGEDEDGKTFDLVEGQDYVLMTGGGPWNDSIDDRYDAAFRFYDGADWGEWEELDIELGEDICDDSFLDPNGSIMAWTAEADQVQLQIRVNDEDDEFDDNSGDIEYYFLDGIGFAQSCANLWSMDDLIGSVTIDSTDSDYQRFTLGGYAAYMTEGMYALKINGSYLDNGVADDDIELADYPELATEHDDWLDVNFFTGSEYCEDEGADYITYYGAARNDFYSYSKTYGQGEASPYARVNDGDSNFGNNSGTIEAELYESTYTAPASDCSLQYEKGTLLDSVVIFAESEFGKQIPIQTNGLVPGQMYYIENAGYGYINNGSVEYDFQIGINLNEGEEQIDHHWAPDLSYPDITWYNPSIFAWCDVPLDENHTGYYFMATKEHIFIRATPPLTGENEGAVNVNLYGAVPYSVPDEEYCSDYLTVDTLLWRGSVDADSTTGDTIDYSVFEPGEEYAIKVVSPAYTDPDGSGKTGEIRRSMPGSGAVEWASFEDWGESSEGGGICYEQISDYDIVYFRAGALSDYEVRATEPTGGNSGTFSFEVWGTERTKEPVVGCELRDYGDVDMWFVIKEVGIVYGNNDGSVNSNPEVMANQFTQEESKFKIQVDYINNQEDEDSTNYVLQISNDGGASWVFLEDWVDCWVDLEDPAARGYFTTPKTGGPFLLRVYDAGGNYIDNPGGLQYKMWIDEIEADPGDMGNFYDTVTAGWGTGCTAVCVPPGWLEVGQWVEYARCRLTRWLAWCPWHAEAIERLGNEFRNLEPIGTILDLMGLGLALRDEFNVYTWSDDEGGGDIDDMQIQAPQNFLFAPEEGGGGDIPLVGADSIWGGGEIELSGPDGYSYSSECDSVLADSLGDNLGQPVCFAANVINVLGLSTWIQWLWDIAMIIGFGFYLNKNWIRPNSGGGG